MNKLLSLLFISILLLSTSCSDKEDGDVEGIILIVNPESPTYYKNQGDPVAFSFNVKSEEKIQSVNVYKQSSNQLNSERDTVFSTSPNTTSYNGFYEFRYQIPQDESDYERYTFEVRDVLNQKKDQYRIVYPIGLLKSFEVKLKSSISSSENGGFDLKNRKVILTDTSIATLAFYDATDTLNNSSKALSNKWIGVNGTEFVRNNEFNFAQASAKTVKNAFESSNAVSQIGEIKNNDIILIKYKISQTTVTYAVVSINSITDEVGAENDVYNFVLKYAQ